jgi:hypothetical protein
MNGYKKKRKEMIKTANNIIINEQVIEKTIINIDPITNEESSEVKSFIEYDVVCEDNKLIERWDWEVDPNNVEIPTIETLLERTGIKFGVSKWQLPDDTIL